MTRESYLKHKAVIEAWANGAELEFKTSSGGHWRPLQCHDPYFRKDEEYRVKPVPLERWLVVWESGALYSVHISEDAARRSVGNGQGLRVVHMREVV